MSLPNRQPNHPDAAGLLRSLARFRRRLRLALIVRRVGMAVAVLLVLVLAIGLLDYVLRLPAAVRWVLLAGLLTLAVLGFVRLIWPALRLHPSLTELALRIERQRPEVRGLLASAVDFAQGGSSHPAPSPIALALSRRAVAAALAAYKPSLLAGLLRSRRAARGAAALMLASCLLALPAILVPALWLTGASRILTPWSDAAWPKRTGVVNATAADIHALGSTLPLRAVLTKANRPAAAMDVLVEYRMLAADGASIGETHRELLTWQERTITVAGAAHEPAVQGALFERLIEPSGAQITYRFVTEDDQTPWRSILLVEPPAIAQAKAIITAPPYISAVPALQELAEPVEVSLGAGLDERAVAPPSLQGSLVELHIELTKPAELTPSLEKALAALEGVSADAITVAKVGRLSEPLAEESAEPSGPAYIAKFTLQSDLRLPIVLTDEHGIVSQDTAIFHFPVRTDAPPSVTITDPPRDLSVLPTASLDITAAARDDVALASLALQQTVLVPAGGPDNPSGPGGATEQRGPPQIIEQLALQNQTEAGLTFRLELAPLEVKPGAEVSLVALASDVYVGPAGQPRAVVQSSPRRLRIISETEFSAPIRGQLAELRQAAISIDEQQREIRGQIAEQGADAAARREQAQVTQRLSQQAAALEDLQQRMQQNRLDDAALQDLLAQAADALQQAGAASAQASQTLDQAAGERQDQDDEKSALTEEQQRQVQRSQDEVEAQLERLIAALDTGQDTWLIRRTIESMAAAQRRLQARTAQTGQQTAGRELDQLTSEQREKVQQIADDQSELARQLQDLLQEMARREQALEQADPAAAAAMRSAKQSAQQAGLEQMMQAAAREAAQNQMAQAGNQQQAAAQALEQMLQELDDTQEQRVEALRRMLASIIQSLQALVQEQQAQLAALADARAAGDFTGLDAGMINLHHNTLGVLDVIKTSGPELAPIVSLVGKAANAQSQAILELRRIPVAADAAAQEEQRSLSLLEQALEQAGELDQRLQQQQQEQKRRQLREAYRAMLEREVALHAAAAPLAELKQLGRRERIEARNLGSEQQQLRGDLEALQTNLAELADAAVFHYANLELEAAMANAAAALDAADLPLAMANIDRTIMLLQAMVQALDESPPEERFDRPPGQQGGGQGQGRQQQELIPPIAQLKLLRQLQIDVAARTAGAEAEAAQEVIDAVGRQQRDLAELAAELLEALKQQGGPPPPTLPGPEPPAEPENPAEQPRQNPPPQPRGGPEMNQGATLDEPLSSRID